MRGFATFGKLAHPRRRIAFTCVPGWGLDRTLHRHLAVDGCLFLQKVLPMHRSSWRDLNPLATCAARRTEVHLRGLTDPDAKAGVRGCAQAGLLRSAIRSAKADFVPL